MALELTSRRCTEPRRQRPTTCRVSVVIPTFKRPALLDRCLRALAEQSLDPAQYEIIVVDDGPSSDTRAIATWWQHELKAHVVRYVANWGAHGPAAARNLGWRAARAPIIAFTDDDCIPRPDWLERGLAALDDAQPPLDAVCGRIIVPIPDQPTDYEYTVAHGLEHAEFATANTFCRRTALEAVKGFDERFTRAWREDSDLQFSLLERGCRVGTHRDPVVLHPVRPAPPGISVRLQANNVFNALLYKKHPALYRQRIQAAPPWRYYVAVAALAVAVTAAVLGARSAVFAASAVWAFFTVSFCARRLQDTSRNPRHVAEMAWTSVVIPPLAVYWRLRGALRYRTPFL